MESNKFFLWLGRITSILVFVGVLVVVGILLSSLNWNTRFDVEPSPQDQADERWYWAIEERLHTDNIQVLRLENRHEKELFYTNGNSSQRSKNLLFVGSDAAQTRLLFKTNKQEFGYDVLTFTDESKNEIPYLIYYQVIKADTNQDGELSHYDSVMLAVSNLDGTGYTELMPKNGEILKIYRHLQEQCLYMIQKNDVQLTKTCFDLSNFSKKKEFSFKLE